MNNIKNNNTQRGGIDCQKRCDDPLEQSGQVNFEFMIFMI